MAALTDIAYFQAELQLPNTDQQAGQDYYKMFIDQYEAEYFNLLLGPALYKQFTDGLAVDPIDQKWTDLKNQLYVVRDSAKISPVANFIYFYIVRRGTYTNSGTGLVQNKNENSTPVSTLIECSRAWNKCAALSFEVYKYLQQNVATYGRLPYELRCPYDYTIDWAYWWGSIPYNYRKMVPEIFQYLNPNGL